MGWISVLNQEGAGSILVFPISYALPAGKWYWEIKVANAGGSADPLMAATARFGAYAYGERFNGNLGESADSWAFSLAGKKFTKNMAIPCGASVWNDGDVVMIAVDTTRRCMWFGANGNWFGTNGNWLRGVRKWFGNDQKGMGKPDFSDLHAEIVPAVASMHGGTGTLHLFIPSNVENYTFSPPPGFTLLEAGARDLLPKPTFIQSITQPDPGLQIVGEPSPNRLVNRRVYQDLASAYITKRNWFMAEKLTVQVEACDPNEQSVKENMIWMQSLRETHSMDSDSNEWPDERLFDFAYIPTEKCGSGAHGTLLAVHPESTIPTSPQTQVAFQENAERSLLRHFQQVVLPCHPNLKIGLVMDARISGARQQPSGIVTGEEYAERLSRIVRPDGFLQAIRHPFLIARSTYNSHVIQYLYGNYSFAFVNPASPFSGDYIDIRSSDIWSRCGKTDCRNYPEVDPTRLMDRFEFAIRTSRPYSVGKAYAKYFDQWRILDLDRAGRERGRKRMGATYSAIGIRGDFSHPLDQMPYRDLIHFAMQKNYIRVNVEGIPLTIFLGRAGQTICSNDVDFIELFWTEENPSLAEPGFNVPLCLAVPKNEWVPLSRSAKQRIVYSREFEEFFGEVFVPCWMADYKIWRNAVDRYLIGDIDATLARNMLSGVREEAEAFLKIHPSVEESWSDLVNMV